MKELIKLRKELGLSQAQMAKRLGVSSNTLCAIEKGRRKATYDLLVKAASSCGRKLIIIFYED